MSARIVRTKKEARALFWPWCAVVAAGALPIFVPHIYAEPFSFLSFFIGVPLLASLSVGNEFREHTLSLWLTQPVSRMQLWGEKMSVMVPAVISAGLASGLVMFLVTWPHFPFVYKVGAVVYVFVAMASATFWTLAAKSTTGGLLVICSMLWIGELFSGGVESNSGGLRNAPLSPAATVAMLCTLGLSVAAVMLWLGARRLARFQLSGGSAEGDLLVSGPVFLPAGLAEWFRCRPSGAFLNLVRKELRLLRPLWVIELMVVLYLAALAVFRLLPSPPVVIPETVLQWVLVGPVGSLCIGMAGLAGMLSLGEEKTSGTHALQMTQPISIRRQWLTKMVIGLLTGQTCAVLFPVLTMVVGGYVYGSPQMYTNFRWLPDLLILYTILTAACFWCACAANGTVRAATWAVPVIAAVPFASAGGLWLGRQLAQTTGTLRDIVLARFHLSPLTLTSTIDYARTHDLWLFVPVFLFGLIQSYWLYRAPQQSSTLWMLRCMLPLVAVALLWSFSASAGFLSSQWEPFEETHRALDNLQLGPGKLLLTGESLAKSSRLTPLTQHWLQGSTILVTPDPTKVVSYRATIHLAGGRECLLTVTRYGASAASCGKPGGYIPLLN